MTIRFRVDDILPALSSVTSVVSTRNVIEILECVLCELDGGRLTMTASDSDTMVSRSVLVDVVETEEVGSFAIRSKELTSVLGSLQGDEVTMKIEDGAAKCTYTHGEFSLPVRKGADFPKLYKEKDVMTQSITMGGQKLSDALSFTQYAIGDDVLRPVLSGVCLVKSGESALFYGTDAQRLAKYGIAAGVSGEDASIILPKKPVAILSKSLTHYDGEVRVSFDEKKARFEMDNMTLTTKLIEGKFPNAEAIIPKDEGVTFSVDKKAFLKALRRVLPLGSSAKLVVLDLSLGTMGVSSENMDYLTKASENMTCDYAAAPMKIGFNGEKLQTTMAAIPSDTVKVTLFSPSRAAIFAPSEEAPTHVCVSLLMPMMLA